MVWSRSAAFHVQDVAYLAPFLKGKGQWWVNEWPNRSDAICPPACGSLPDTQHTCDDMARHQQNLSPRTAGDQVCGEVCGQVCGQVRGQTYNSGRGSVRPESTAFYGACLADGWRGA